jgi:hypothetical protein
MKKMIRKDFVKSQSIFLLKKLDTFKFLFLVFSVGCDFIICIEKKASFSIYASINILWNKGRRIVRRGRLHLIMVVSWDFFALSMKNNFIFIILKFMSRKSLFF